MSKDIPPPYEEQPPSTFMPPPLHQGPPPPLHQGPPPLHQGPPPSVQLHQPHTSSYGTREVTQQTVILTTTSNAPVFLGPSPVNTVCPHCHAHIRTNVTIEPIAKTHMFAILLLMFGCCCIPYCMDSCKGKKHFCPHCSAYLGAYTD